MIFIIPFLIIMVIFMFLYDADVTTIFYEKYGVDLKAFYKEKVLENIMIQNLDNICSLFFQWPLNVFAYDSSRIWRTNDRRWLYNILFQYKPQTKIYGNFFWGSPLNSKRRSILSKPKCFTLTK